MYQFIHVESYSRSAPKSAKGTGKEGRSVRYIIDEAIRAEGAHPHIVDPEPPRILYGESPEALEQLCEDWAASVTDTRGRKTRKDALCLLAGVISAPASIGTDGWESFKADSLEWLKKKYGSTLRSVIEHTDEAHPHLHFYAIPEKGNRFETVHEGRAASAQAKQEGLKKGGQNQAYKSAMREFQDDFYEKVGIEHGFARIGPGRRRLSRQEWKQEQTQAAANARAIELATKKVRESEIEADLIISAAEGGAESITRSAQEDAEEVKSSAELERAQVIKDAKADALALAKKALARADEIEREAEQKGIEKGMDQVEQMPWFQRVARVIVRAIRQRDELKKTVDQLTTERDDLEKKSKSLAARARHYLTTGRTIQQSVKDLELELTQAQVDAERVAELEIENEKLINEVSSTRSQVQHWSAIAESYMMREQDEVDKKTNIEQKPSKHRGLDSDYQP